MNAIQLDAIFKETREILVKHSNGLDVKSEYLDSKAKIKKARLSFVRKKIG